MYVHCTEGLPGSEGNKVANRDRNVVGIGNGDENGAAGGDGDGRDYVEGDGAETGTGVEARGWIQDGHRGGDERVNARRERGREWGRK